MRFRCKQYDELGNLYERRDVVYECFTLVEASMAFMRQYGVFPTSVAWVPDGVEEYETWGEVRKLQAKLERLETVHHNRMTQVRSLEKKVGRYRDRLEKYRTSYTRLATYVSKTLTNLTAQSNAVAAEVRDMEAGIAREEDTERVQEREADKARNFGYFYGRIASPTVQAEEKKNPLHFGETSGEVYLTGEPSRLVREKKEPESEPEEDEWETREDADRWDYDDEYPEY